jgi:hypothetical protein
MKNVCVFLLFLFACKTNRRAVSMYSHPTIINIGENDSQDDLLEWSKKLTPAEKDSFVKYFFYSIKEIDDIKKSIDVKNGSVIKNE